ncbi:hypothetical protein [Pseudomonas marginalis]|nr:hypothetical protein [Pseudomonas marginalis]OAJ48532.1 hypothetical protein AO064_06705 [Pseudomonas marginalis]
MNTEKLYTTIVKTIETIESDQDFFPVISALYKTHEETAKSLSGEIRFSTNHSTLWQNFSAQQSSLITRTAEAVRISKFSKITKSITKIEDNLPRDEIEAIHEIESELGKFMTALDNYLDSGNLDTSYALTSIANRFFIALEKLKYLKSVLKQTTAKELINKPLENESLKIYFPDHVSLEGFSNKLLFLSILLEECCNLLNLSTGEGQVEIQKIESGSFFAKISASPLVIALATTIITQSAMYTYNRLDPSQNINNLKQSTEVLEKVLGIRATLVANNIETEGLDEAIKKSTSAIAKNLNRFLGDSSEIQINDHLISTHNHNFEKLSYTNQLVIEDRSEPNQ